MPKSKGPSKQERKFERQAFGQKRQFKLELPSHTMQRGKFSKAALDDYRVRYQVWANRPSQDPRSVPITNAMPAHERMFVVSEMVVDFLKRRHPKADTIQLFKRVAELQKAEAKRYKRTRHPDLAKLHGAKIADQITRELEQRAKMSHHLQEYFQLGDVFQRLAAGTQEKSTHPIRGPLAGAFATTRKRIEKPAALVEKPEEVSEGGRLKKPEGHATLKPEDVKPGFNVEAGWRVEKTAHEEELERKMELPPVVRKTIPPKPPTDREISRQLDELQRLHELSPQERQLLEGLRKREEKERQRREARRRRD